MHGNNTQRSCVPVTNVFFLKGSTLCKTFILEVGKATSFLSGWDTLGVDFYDTPGRQASCLTLYINPLEIFASILSLIPEIWPSQVPSSCFSPVQVAFLRSTRSLIEKIPSKPLRPQGLNFCRLSHSPLGLNLAISSRAKCFQMRCVARDGSAPKSLQTLETVERDRMCENSARNHSGLVY